MNCEIVKTHQSSLSWLAIQRQTGNLIVPDEMDFVRYSSSFQLYLFDKLLESFLLLNTPIRCDVHRPVAFLRAQLPRVSDNLSSMVGAAH